MKLKLFDALKFLVGWPISIISIIFLLKFFPSSVNSLSKLEKINVFVILLSIFFFQLYFVLRAIVWQEILKYKKHKLPLRQTLFLWGFSELKRYAPGNVWSFLSRIVLFTQLGIPNSDIFHSLLIEIQTLIFSGFLVSLFSMNFLFKILPLPFEHSFFVQPLIFAIIIIVSGVFVISKKFGNRFFLPNLKPIQILKLLSLTFLSLFSFGIGTYFAGASIFYLNPRYFIDFSSFFVFALLVGYLSVITPMGLGVREGVITIVLSKIISLPYAALASIFMRLVFIVSEVIFLFFSWLIYEIKNKIILKSYSFLEENKQEVLLLIFIFSFILYFTTASFLRYDAFFTGRFDLGNMDQTVWNTIHGRIFELTDPNGTYTVSRLAFHADFLLILLSPLYLIWNSPKMLLLIQTLVVSIGAIFVYLTSKDTLKNKNISLALSSAYLLNPALQYSTLYDFHPVVLATTFLLAAFYFLKKRKYLFMVIFLFLSGISKEDIWIITSLFGLYLLIFEKKKLLGLSVFSFSALIFYVLFFIAIPKESGGQHFALSYYSEFGDTPTTIIKNILTSPLKILKTITGKSQIIYLKELFAPLGFLSILSPIYLIFTAPTFLIDLLSNNSQIHQIYYQYSSSITPFLFIAAIYAISFLRKTITKIPINFYSFFIIFCTLFSAYNFGPILGSKNPDISMFTENLANDNLIDRFLQRIPKRYSVSATNEVGSHLSHRQKIYTIPLGVDKADIIIMLNQSSLSSREIKIIKEIDNKLLSDKNYFIVYRDSEFMVFKRKGLRRSFYYF